MEVSPLASLNPAFLLKISQPNAHDVEVFDTMSQLCDNPMVTDPELQARKFNGGIITMKITHFFLFTSLVMPIAAFAHPLKVESNGCGFYTTLSTTSDPSHAAAIEIRGNVIGQSSGMEFIVPAALLPLKEGTDVTYQATYLNSSSVHLQYAGGVLNAKVSLPDNFSTDNIQIKIDPTLSLPSTIQYKRFFVLNPFKPVEQFNCSF